MHDNVRAGVLRIHMEFRPSATGQFNEGMSTGQQLTGQTGLHQGFTG